VKSIAIVSAKGGVGRTTLCANLGAALSRLGKPVLMVDMDPQNALRLHTGLPVENIDGLARATLAGRDWRSACMKVGNTVFLPHGALNVADRDTFEQLLLDEPDLLKDRLKNLQLADDALVLMDTCAGPALYQRMALAAADFVLLVTLPDAASYASLPTMAQCVDAYCTRRIDFLGSAYVINQIDNARQLGKDVVRVLPTTLNTDLFGSYLGGIHRDESVAEALACQQLVLDYAPDAMASVDIAGCAAALIQAIASTRQRSPA
jgi:cellulose synthase operon protein YhjQ